MPLLAAFGDGSGRAWDNSPVNEDDLLAALDPEQREVALATRGAVCVRAGAGTGKTRAITYRIAHAVRTGVAAPQQILAVTFTSRAAGEMRSRLRDLGIHGVQARTFHSAALSQLRYFWPIAVGGRVPEIKESKAALVAGAAAKLSIPTDVPTIRDLTAEIEWAKVSLIAPEDYPIKARQAGRAGAAGQPLETIGKLALAYEEIKAERGVIDFEDVILVLIGIMLDRPDIARAIRDQYRYFVVDEYQDVSPMQHRLLQLWLGDRRDVCVVGDAAQTIYTFTGASSAYLDNFGYEHKGAAEITLNRNYRSTPEIIALANQIVSEGAGVQPVQLRAMNPSGSAVTFAKYESSASEADGIAAQIKRHAASGVPLSGIAILYRTNAQSAEFERALGAAEIPYILQGQESFFRRAEVRQAMIALRAEARIERNSAGAGAAAGNESAGSDSFALPTLVEGVLRSMGWRAEGPEQQGASRERWESLSTLLTLAQEMWENRHASLMHFVAELEERSELQHAPAVAAVTLSSLHAAKGLEWPVVFLAGMVEGLMPISYATSSEAIAEEKRLLYVGVTRAARELIVSYARASGHRSESKLSRFLGPMWPKELSKSTKARRRASEEALRLERDDPDAYVIFTRLAAWRAGVAREQGKPPYLVFHDAALRAIAAAQPESLQQLSAIRGVGKAKLAEYGMQVLAVVGGAEL